MIIPSFLKAGSTVRIISSAGAIDSELVKGAAEFLRNKGFTVMLGKHVCDTYGRFAGTLESRLQDFQEALDDPETNAIFCSRGGYGTIQLMDKLNLEGFLSFPKWIVGYSDLTMIHNLLHSHEVLSIHGGMARMMSESRQSENESVSRMFSLLQGEWEGINSPTHPLNRQGLSEGLLIGGNLSILYSLRGTPFDLNPDKKILFIEDIGEKPYVVDRMMHNLKLSGFLKNLSGLIVGQFSDYEEDPLFGKTVLEIVASAVSQYDYPVAFDFPVGHTETNLPLVCGANVSLQVTPKLSKLDYLKH
jgi:muramoyltetrapeptide carboxypeptidase